MKKQMRLSIFVICLGLLWAPGTVAESVLPPLAERLANLNPGTRPSVAVVLAGGGAWGLAHVGAIRVIEEAGIPVDIVVGTSMGAIIGGFFAAGYDAAQMEEITTTLNWGSMFGEDGLSGRESVDEFNARSRYALSVDFDRYGFVFNGGLISGVRIMRLLDSLLLNLPADVHFDDLPVRFRAVATDVISGEKVVLDSGSMSEAMRASMSLPAIFNPFPLDDRYLIDGGVVDNLPISVARSLGADIVIAIDMFNGKPLEAMDTTRSPTAVLSRSIEIMRQESSRRETAYADLVISIDAQGFLPTQFERTAEFIRLGEQTARHYTRELAELKTLISNTDEETTKSLPDKPFTEISVTGGTPHTREIAYDYLKSQDINNMTQDKWNLFFNLLDKTGRIHSIRLGRKTTESGETLSVKLEKKPANNNKINLGFLYEATVSSVTMSNLDIIPALTIKGLTTENSKLKIEVEALDAPSFAIHFEQPIGSYFSISPFYQYKRDFTTRITTSSITSQYQTSTNSAGLKMRITPVPGFSLSGDWTAIGFDHDSITEIRAAEGGRFYSLLNASLEIRRLDSPIFPMQGVDVLFNSTLSLPKLGSSAPFIVFESLGNTFLSLGTPFSLAFLWQIATDFSMEPDEKGAAPLFFKPVVSSRRLFPGPLSLEERKGSHILTAGLEAKHNLNWNSQGITVPAFLLVNAAVGVTIQDLSRTEPIELMKDLMFATLNTGAGLRFNSGFGASVRVGLHLSINHIVIPYLTIDIGALGKDRNAF